MRTRPLKNLYYFRPLTVWQIDDILWKPVRGKTCYQSCLSWRKFIIFDSSKVCQCRMQLWFQDIQQSERRKTYLYFLMFSCTNIQLWSIKTWHTWPKMPKLHPQRTWVLNTWQIVIYQQNLICFSRMVHGEGLLPTRLPSLVNISDLGITAMY